MKKFLLFGFAGAMALSSCTSEDVLKVADQQEMSFSAFVDKSTKGAENGTSLNVDGKKFFVWGYKTKTDPSIGITNAPVFATQGTTAFASTDKGQAVTFGSSKWTYTPLRYWDATCSYDFFAVVGPDALNVEPTALGNFAISDFTQADAIVDHHDLMASTHTQSAAGTKSAINLTFRHLLTKVGIYFKTTSKETVTLEEVKVLPIAAQGSAVITSTASEAKAVWTIAQNPTKKGFDTASDFSKVLTTTAVAVFDNMLMIPQNAQSFKIQMRYLVGNETFTREVDLAGTEWKQNNYIIYNISINNGSGNPDGGSPISFDTTTITGWDTATSPAEKPVQ